MAISLILVIVGFVLKQCGSLESRNAAMVWAILCIVPLFGAGALLVAKHAAQEATGVTRPGHNNDPAHADPAS